MDKKYQIFVSSTFSDLVEERQAVSRAILDMGHIPAGMEMFPAADIEQLTYIKKVIDECDYYVLIIGARYGSLDEDGVSYTQREFQYAVETDKTVLAFLHKDMDSVPLGKTDKNDQKREKLEQFIAMVSSGRLIQFWTSAMELRANAIVSLQTAFSQNPQVGWVRANQVASQSALTDIVKYREENDTLKIEISRLKSSVEPKFDDVADISTVMRFGYSYKKNGSIVNSSKNLSIKTFFLNVAPDLSIPSTQAGVEIAFQRALKDRHSVDGFSVNAVSADVLDALMHLVASGLVKMYTTLTIDKTRNVTAFQLTPLGTKIWQENSYIRAPDIDKTDKDITSL